MCRLKGTVDLPTIYNNDSMITCMVNRTQVIEYDLILDYNAKGKNVILKSHTLVFYTLPQILFSNFIGREDITISIVWVIASSGRHHLIDIPVTSECASLPELYYS